MSALAFARFFRYVLQKFRFFLFSPAKFMLVYNHLRKSALTPDDLGVGAVCFMVVYHENSEAKRKERRNMLQINTF